MNGDAASFLKSKFDNICVLLMCVFLVIALIWVDKHGNSDFEKWLQTFASGFAGAYLALLTAARQPWQKNNPTPPDPPAPVQTSANAPAPALAGGGANVPAGWPGAKA